MHERAERHREAAALLEMGRSAEAQPIYEALLTDDPDDARAAFHLGDLLLQRGDLNGIKHLRRAMDVDWSCGVDACALVESALRAMRRDEAADGWAQRHREQLDLRQRVMAERTQLHARDDLVPTGLPPEVQEAIVARCREAGWVAASWIARKNLVTVPASSDFVAVKPKLFAFAGQNRLVRLADAIGGGIAVARLYEERDLMRRLDSLGARRPLR